MSAWLTTLQSISDGKRAGAETRKAVGGLFLRLLEFAVSRSYLARNPAKNASGQAAYVPGKQEIGKTKTEHVFLTLPQLVAIADHCGTFRDLILFAGTCGLRWSEVSALQVQDVRLGERALVHVQRAHKDVAGRLTVGDPKSGDNRKVPVPASIVPMLAQRVEGKAPTDLVFPSARGRALRNANFTKRYYSPAIEAAVSASSDPASFPRPTFHDLRHTAVSLAISQGANVLVVQRIAGHATATMILDTYAGLFDHDLFDSAERIDKALRAATAA